MQPSPPAAELILAYHHQNSFFSHAHSYNTYSNEVGYGSPYGGYSASVTPQQAMSYDISADYVDSTTTYEPRSTIIDSDYIGGHSKCKAFPSPFPPTGKARTFAGSLKKPQMRFECEYARKHRLKHSSRYTKSSSANDPLILSTKCQLCVFTFHVQFRFVR
jgi:hypothetical protein